MILWLRILIMYGVMLYVPTALWAQECDCIGLNREISNLSTRNRNNANIINQRDYAIKQKEKDISNLKQTNLNQQNAIYLRQRTIDIQTIKITGMDKWIKRLQNDSISDNKTIKQQRDSIRILKKEKADRDSIILVRNDTIFERGKKIDKLLDSIAKIQDVLIDLRKRVFKYSMNLMAYNENEKASLVILYEDKNLTKPYNLEHLKDVKYKHSMAVKGTVSKLKLRLDIGTLAKKEVVIFQILIKTLDDKVIYDSNNKIIPSFTKNFQDFLRIEDSEKDTEIPIQLMGHGLDSTLNKNEVYQIHINTGKKDYENTILYFSLKNEK